MRGEKEHLLQIQEQVGPHCNLVNYKETPEEEKFEPIFILFQNYSDFMLHIKFICISNQHLLQTQSLSTFLRQEGGNTPQAEGTTDAGLN